MAAQPWLFSKGAISPAYSRMLLPREQISGLPWIQWLHNLVLNLSAECNCITSKRKESCQLFYLFCHKSSLSNLTLAAGYPISNFAAIPLQINRTQEILKWLQNLWRWFSLELGYITGQIHSLSHCIKKKKSQKAQSICWLVFFLCSYQV